jgi:peptidoglycan hydrolase CwlO-like protein
MNPVTKNDLQTALQQATNTILTRTVSYQDATNIAQSASQRLCTKQDMITILNGMRDNFLDRVSSNMREQQALTRTLLTQLESMQRRMAQLESKLDAARLTIREVQSNTEQSYTQQSSAPKAEPATIRRDASAESAEPVFYDYFGG